MSLFNNDAAPAADRPGFVSRHLRALIIAAIVVVSVVTAVAVATRPGFFSDADTEEHRIRLVTVAEGLEHPWGLAFLPNRDILVTERRGHLRIIRGGVLQAAPIEGVPTVHAHNQGGLLDVAVHPRFAENGLVYLTYSKAGRLGSTTALARGRFDGQRLLDVADVFVAEAWGDGDAQYGSRIAFGLDGSLYVAVGDRRDRPKRAQDPQDDGGKLLRLRDDGSVPDDNPFVGRAGYRPEIFALGFRCPQGLAVDPRTGAVLIHEHGPKGGDEINLARPGLNYGWPLATYGREYSGELINGGATSGPGLEPPVVYWVPSIAPSGMAVYTGDRFPKWSGHVFVGALAGRHLRRVVIEGGRAVHQEVMLRHLRQRIRDVRQGPDGFLYIATDEERGVVLRLEPDERPAS
jgi:glucose/arabinose dehydrogenase